MDASKFIFKRALICSKSLQESEWMAKCVALSTREQRNLLKTTLTIVYKIMYFKNHAINMHSFEKNIKGYTLTNY